MANPSYLSGSNSLPASKDVTKPWLEKGGELSEDFCKHVDNVQDDLGQDKMIRLGVEDHANEAATLSRAINALHRTLEDCYDQKNLLISSVVEAKEKLETALRKSPELGARTAEPSPATTDELMHHFLKHFGSLDRIRELSPENKSELFSLEVAVLQKKVEELQFQMANDECISEATQAAERTIHVELENLKITADERQIRVEKLEQTEADMKDKIRSLESDLNASEETVSELLNLNEIKAREVRTRDQTIHQKKKEYEATLEEKSKQCESLTLKMNNAATSYEQLQAQDKIHARALLALQSASSQAGHQHDSEIKTLEEFNNELQSQNDALTLDKRELKITVQDLEKIIERLERDAKQANDDKIKWNQRLKKAEEDGENWRDMLDVKDLQVQQESERATKAKRSHQGLLQDYNQQAQDMQKLQDSLRTLEVEQATYHRQRDEWTNQKSEQEDVLATLREEKNKVRDELEATKASVNDLERRNQEIQAQLDTAKREAETAKSKVDTELGELRAKLTTLEDEKVGAKTALETAQRDAKTALETAQRDAKTALETAQRDANTAKIEADEALDSARREAVTARTERDDAIARADEFQIKFTARFENELDADGAELEHRDTLDTLEKLNRTITSQKRQLEESGEEKQAEIHRLQTKLESQNRDLGKQIETLEDGNAKRRSEYRGYFADMAKTRALNPPLWDSLMDSIESSSFLFPSRRAEVAPQCIVASPWMDSDPESSLQQLPKAGLTDMLVQLYYQLETKESEAKMCRLLENITDECVGTNSRGLFSGVFPLIFASARRRYTELAPSTGETRSTTEPPLAASIPLTAEIFLMCLYQLGLYVQRRYSLVDMAEITKLGALLQHGRMWPSLYVPLSGGTAKVIDAVKANGAFHPGFNIGLLKGTSEENILVYIDAGMIRVVAKDRCKFRHLTAHIVAPNGNDSIEMPIPKDGFGWWMTNGVLENENL